MRASELDTRLLRQAQRRPSQATRGKGADVKLSENTEIVFGIMVGVTWFLIIAALLKYVVG